MSFLKASIDIGSNSILLLLIESDSGAIKILENESNITGLGRDLDKNGIFIDEAMADSFNVLKEYRERCESHGLSADQIIATATEASRVAANAGEFYKKIYEELGITVQIITGDGEAYYSSKGILFDKKIKDEIITIMDIGGASTELIKINTSSGQIIEAFSMPVGVVRINNWRAQGLYKSKTDEIFENYKEKINKVLTDKLYCVAGTMTSVGNIYLNNKEFVEHEVNGVEFDVKTLDSFKLRFKDYSSEALLEEFPFLGKRSKTIYSGILLAIDLIQKLGVNDIYVSTYGLRYGTIFESKIKDEYVWKC